MTAHKINDIFAGIGDALESHIKVTFKNGHSWINGTGTVVCHRVPTLRRVPTVTTVYIPDQFSPEGIVPQPMEEDVITIVGSVYDI